MSNLARLRERALAHLTSRQVRYPVCLDPELREELRKLAELLKTVADGAAAKAAELATTPANPEDAPKRRTIADKPTPPTVADLADAAEKAMAPLRERTNTILASAAEADSLVVVVFGMPADAVDDPAAFYERIAGQHEQRTLAGAAIRRELVERSYLRTESAGGDDLGFGWDDVRAHVLNHADLEMLDQSVLELYREPSAIPFDPVSFGQPPQS